MYTVWVQSFVTTALLSDTPPNIEVEEVFTVPVNWLLNHEPYMHLIAMEPVPSADFPFEKIMNGTQYQWRSRAMEEWFYEYEQYTIWGLTARILKHFVEIIK